MFAGALVPRRGTDAGVPGPRRSADECDAGWFAPVATRRRSLFFSWAAQIANKKTTLLSGPRPLPYSVLLNSAIAITVIPSPMTATMPSDSATGTGQPTQVMTGARCCSNTAGMLRWLNTACRMGPTM